MSRADPFSAAVSWTRKYLRETPDDALLLWPGIAWEDQPCCTLWNGKGAKGKTSPGTVTPEEWTRQKLRYYSGLLAKFIKGEYQIGTFSGDVIVNDALSAYRILVVYRGMAEGKTKC